MRSAREEFGPPQKQDPNLLKALESSRIKEQVQGIGKDLQNAGVKQDGQSHLSLASNNPTNGNAVQKNMAVAQGDRPALTPCDGNMQQAKAAGQALQKAGVTGGQSQSAAKSFSPPSTPSVPAPSVGARGR